MATIERSVMYEAPGCPESPVALRERYDNFIGGNHLYPAHAAFGGYKTSGVVATPEALEVIERLRAAHGALALFQSGGCCDGSSPICLIEGELPMGPDDLLLGTVGGTPFYIDAEQHRRWRSQRLILEVRDGAAEGFSLEGLEGVHFLTRPDLR